MQKRSFLFWSALIAGFFIMIAGATGNALAVSGKITIAFAAESNVLDVTKAAAGVDWYFNQQIYEMLVTADNKLNRVNWLAKSWKLNYVRGKPVITVNLRKGVKFHPLLHGGGHEQGLRSSTENVAGVVGLGEAAKIAREEMAEEEREIRLLRDTLEKGIVERIPEVKVNGYPQNKLYNTLNICIKHIEGESILINLDFEGICASSGSACTSGSLEPSHVLLAMGIPHEIAHGSLRLSLGKYTTSKDIDKVLEVLPPIVERLRKMSPFWEKV